MAAQKKKTGASKKQYVVVRTYSAGVHVGTLERRDGKEAVLTNARRIWRWFGANTLHEVATNGVASNSKVSVAVPTITLTEAIEIIPCSDKARACLESATWAP